MTIKRKSSSSQPDGCICEQFPYLPKLGVCRNSSDINELYAIGRLGVRAERLKRRLVIWK